MNKFFCEHCQAPVYDNGMGTEYGCVHNPPKTTFGAWVACQCGRKHPLGSEHGRELMDNGYCHACLLERLSLSKGTTEDPRRYCEHCRVEVQCTSDGLVDVGCTHYPPATPMGLIECPSHHGPFPVGIDAGDMVAKTGMCPRCHLEQRTGVFQQTFYTFCQHCDAVCVYGPDMRLIEGCPHFPPDVDDGIVTCPSCKEFYVGSENPEEIKSLYESKACLNCASTGQPQGEESVPNKPAMVHYDQAG